MLHGVQAVSLVLKKVAAGVVDLAKERVDELLTGLSTDRPLKTLLVNAYLQGAIDGAAIEQRRAVARGSYKKKAAK